jgi:hypothetical protein
MSAPPGDRDERKERVIHARVPESLDHEIRRRAGGLGLSVSNLVRNVLQNAFGLVEDIVADSAEIARSARGGGDGGQESQVSTAGKKLGFLDVRPRVLGWQTARLAVNAVCEGCNEILPRGAEAAIGIVTAGATPPFRCLACAGAPRRAEADDERP